jgi:hypothetical protein
LHVSAYLGPFAALAQRRGGERFVLLSPEVTQQQCLENGEERFGRLKQL